MIHGNKKSPRHPKIPRANVMYYLDQEDFLRMRYAYNIGLRVTKLNLHHEAFLNVGRSIRMPP